MTALRAITGGTAISDVQLAGNVIQQVDDAGQYTGTITLMALGLSNSRIDLSLSNAQALTEMKTLAAR